jgi:lipopolysaccharide export system protein LptC
MLNRPDNSDGHQRPVSDSGKNYADARFHSQRVRRLKIILPVMAVVISLIFVAVSFIRTALPENVALESIKVEDGKLVMEGPAISGTNADGIRYTMNAEKALQDIKNPNLIALKLIKAEMPVSASLMARIVGQSGLYDRQTDKLVMDAPFTIKMSNGMEASFQNAAMDVKAGEMTTEKPVSITAKQSSIVAQRLKMADKGQIIIFEGKVRINMEASALQNKGK